MDIVEHKGKWVIIHAGKEVAETFDTEADAWTWADKHIDDQVFDGPNDYSPPLTYRPSSVVN